MISFGVNTGTVIGFSMSSLSILEGNGTLATLTFEPTASGGTISMDNLIISGQDGVQVVGTAPADASVPGCNDADCSGECGGLAEIDNCGTCDADSSNDCVQDCAGTWGGDLVDDECGVCDGDNSSCSDECGIPYGDNSSCADECGVPNGDNSSCADLSLIHISEPTRPY